MPRKPRARTLTSHLRKLDVTWRLYAVKVAGFGAFGDATRWQVEIVDVQERTKAA